MRSCFASVSLAVLLALGLADRAAGQEPVRFPSRDGDLTGGAPTQLTGRLFRPPGRGPFAAIVALHECEGLFNRNGRLAAREADWARRLSQTRHVVLLPDSFGPRGLRNICGDQARSARMPFAERVRDALAAADFLARQPTVDGVRIGLMGWRSGAETVLAVMGGEPRRFRAGVALYPECHLLLQRAGLQLTFARPVTILLGGADDYERPFPCERLIAARRDAGDRVEVRYYDNAYHHFDQPNLPLRERNRDGQMAPTARADALERVPTFFAAHLRR
jgi:dienelactone hydrolase